MLKIGVLTYHNNENRGAILQGHSLQKSIEQNLDAEAEIVEYRTSSKEVSRRNRVLLNKRPWICLKRLKDRRIVEDFIDSQLPTSNDSIITDSHERAVQWVEGQDYDFLVTGSDEVWKVTPTGGDGLFSRFFPSRPFPNLYVLDPSLSASKVAYAASANETNPNNAEPETLETFRKHVSSYDYISVRDRHTESLLESIGVEKDIYRVPDPTLLVDIPRGDVEEIFTRNGIQIDEPILGIHSPAKQPFGSICKRYRERGYQIVAPTTSPHADLELVGKVDPFEYYALYEYFDMVVTTSLHSTIFSLKNRTPFATIDVDSTYADLESKTHSLLADFSLLERHIDAVEGGYAGLVDRVENLDRPLDETHIENCIEEQQERGVEFLEQIQVAHEAHN